MINIEILDSSFSSAIGHYPFEFDIVYIGRSKKADLIFNDKELPLRYLTIKFVHNQLIIENESDSPFYFVNGKKLSGARKLKIGDIIQFGKHKLKILDASLNPPRSKNDDLHLYYDSFNKESPELKFLLEFLEEEIVKLEP